VNFHRTDGRRRRLPSVVFAAAVLVFQGIALVGAETAAAAVFSGGFSPKIFSGGADLNGDGAVTGRDDSQDFFGDADIIDGKLDCDTWLGTANKGDPGSGAITAADNCTLVAFDGTSDGVTITVTAGAFSWTTGTALPTVYNATDPANPGVAAADFAWSTIGGKVDSDGDESIGGTDCTFGLIGQTVDAGFGAASDGADVLGSDAGCGFAGSPLSSTLDGLVDLNSDEGITAADSCTNGCFFGHNVTSGLVQAEGSTSAPTITSFSPSSGPVGTSVTINGTNFTGATSVAFNGVSATTFTVNSATKITATVPTGATTGPITVTTPSGTATSTSNFAVTAPHSRSITLRLLRHLVARGRVSLSASTDTFTQCIAGVAVKIQRRAHGHWKTVGSTTTKDTGAYKKRIKDKPGKYRAKAPSVTIGTTDTCLAAVSPTVRNR
jgi:hypothetical protein